MIKAVFYQNNNLISGFDITGHSGQDVHGNDIVCSAVSSAAYLTANTVTDVLNIKADISVSDGKMHLVINDLHDIRKAQTVIQGLLLHLNGLLEQYPEFIKIEVTEV